MMHSVVLSCSFGRKSFLPLSQASCSWLISFLRRFFAGSCVEVTFLSSRSLYGEDVSIALTSVHLVLDVKHLLWFSGNGDNCSIMDNKFVVKISPSTLFFFVKSVLDL